MHGVAYESHQDASDERARQQIEPSNARNAFLPACLQAITRPSGHPFCILRGANFPGFPVSRLTFNLVIETATRFECSRQWQISSLHSQLLYVCLLRKEWKCKSVSLQTMLKGDTEGGVHLFYPEPGWEITNTLSLSDWLLVTV